MILYINTTESDSIKFALKRSGRVLAEKKVKAERLEAEKLLPAIEAMLKAKKINLKQIKKIEVANRGGSFTSLRVGVVTANALGYALGIPVEAVSKATKVVSSRSRVKFNVIEPVYDRELEITQKKYFN